MNRFASLFAATAIALAASPALAAGDYYMSQPGPYGPMTSSKTTTPTGYTQSLVMPGRYGVMSTVTTYDSATKTKTTTMTTPIPGRAPLVSTWSMKSRF